MRTAKSSTLSNGDYGLVRPLGLVPGGKGLLHHENLLRLTAGGVVAGVLRALSRPFAQTADVIASQPAEAAPISRGM